MNQVNCPVCGNKCIKVGKTKAGSQRWLCGKCNSSVTHKIDNSAKELQIFLDWLFGKESQSSMPGDGRTFRRKTVVLCQEKVQVKHELFTSIICLMPHLFPFVLVLSNISFRSH